MSEQLRTRGTVVLGLLASALLLIPAVPSRIAAQEMDQRWLPWLGCWQPVGEASQAPLLCLNPLGGETGVEFVTVADGQIVSREIVRADGQARPSTREGCEGSDRSSFSADAHRIYVRSEHVCEGGVRQTATSMMAMISPTEWVDASTVEANGEPSTWVQRYQLATTAQAEAAGFAAIAAERMMAVRAARRGASTSPEIDDVIDASAQVHAKTVEAWLVERNRRFDLDADKLIQLADAGVPPSVIDVVVAVSHPDRFRLSPDREYETVAEAPRRREPFGYGYDPYRWGIGYRPFGFGYSPFWYSPYSPFGYGYGFGPGYGYGYGYYPVIISVEPRDPGGRVVNGRGYTRPRGGSVSRDPGPSVRDGGGSIGSGGSRGSGGGSGGSSTGRTARPRGGT
ncbi:MAG: hypothetical protein HY701_07995 [Gemmatimonadetes bacterium]|nr:hypothetical protein [Gemmatimonadota bacterium]